MARAPATVDDARKLLHSSLRLTLSFSAAKLPDMDSLFQGKSDPYLLLYASHEFPLGTTPPTLTAIAARHADVQEAPVMRTEVIQDNLNPAWTTKATITVRVPLTTDIVFVARCYDSDSKKGEDPATANPGADDYIGYVVFQLSQLFDDAGCVPKQEYTGQFQSSQSKGAGFKVAVASQPLDVKAQAVSFRFAGKKLVGMDDSLFTAPSDAYFKMSRLLPYGATKTLHISEVVSDADPLWNSTTVLLLNDLQGDVNNDSNAKVIKIELFDRDVVTADDSMGWFVCSVAELIASGKRHERDDKGFPLFQNNDPVNGKYFGSVTVVAVEEGTYAALTGTLPDSFPLAVSYPRFHNWTYELDFPHVPMVTPHTVDEIELVCNWAAENGYCVRPCGERHGWAPFNMGPRDKGGSIILLDMREMKAAKVEKGGGGAAAALNFPVVRSQPGIMMQDLMHLLESTPNDETTAPTNLGYTFANIPGLSHVTLGGVVAINGHGTSIDVPGKPPSLIGNGSVSSHIVEFTAICFDAADQKYKRKTFRRGQMLPGNEESAFLVNLGRTILVEIVLKVQPNFCLRCRSRVDIHSSTLFATPTAAVPVPPGSCQELLNATGRLEIIYFPYLPFNEDYPWVHTWERCDTKPADSVQITKPNPYPFMSDLPPMITSLYNMMMGYPTDKAQLISEVRAFEKSVSGSDVAGVATILALLATLVTLLTGALDTKRMTKIVMRIQQFITRSNFSPKHEPRINDIWGTSGNTLMYVTSNTLRGTANGYAVLMNRKDVQRGIQFFTTAVKSILDEMASRGLFPVNAGMEIRITGLDRPDSTGLPGADVPHLSAISWSPQCDEHGWDVALWLDALSLPQSKGLNEFYTKLEEQLTGYRYFQPPYGLLRPEYSKGWAYTLDGPHNNYDFLSFARRQLPHFEKARAILEKYDAKRIFSCAFLQEVFNRYCIPQQDSASGVSQRRREVVQARKLYEWEVQRDAPGAAEWGPPQVRGFPSSEHHGFWSLVPGGPKGLDTLVTTSMEALLPSLSMAVKGAGLPLAFDDFSKLYAPMGGHPMIAKWRRDDVWSYEQVAGILPTLVRKATMADFTTDEKGLKASMLPPTLPDGSTLEHGVQNGHVFILDYRKELEVGRSTENFIASPLVVFFTATHSVLDFIPLAIQLVPNGPVYTPADDAGGKNQWLMAKMKCQNAMVSLQDSVYHNLHVHWINEAAYVSARRQLSERHPILQIMMPHAWGTININEVTRGNLAKGAKGPLAARNLGLDGGYKKVCVQAWSKHTWDMYDVRRDLQRRGVEQLKQFPYNEDAPKIYDLEMAYARDLVYAFYENDDEVGRDFEIQAMVQELKADCKMRGALWATGKFETREKLAEFLGIFIHNATAGHAVYNNYTWYSLGYLPMGCLLLKLPIPTTPKDHEAHRFSEAQLCQALPHQLADTLLILNTPALVDVPEPNHPMMDIFLAQPNYLKSFPVARELAMKHRDDLRDMSVVVQRRNRARPTPYLCLDPAHVAQSINL